MIERQENIWIRGFRTPIRNRSPKKKTICLLVLLIGPPHKEKVLKAKESGQTSNIKKCLAFFIVSMIIIYIYSYIPIKFLFI